MKTINMLLITALLTGYFPKISTSFAANDKIDSSTAYKSTNVDTVKISESALIGTRFEGHKVEIKNGVVYMDDKSVAIAVLVFIAGIEAGYIVDGVLIYSTGYSGGELFAQGLTNLRAFLNRNANVKTVYLDNRFSTTVRSYITKSGQQCTMNNSGTSYVCAFLG